MEDKELNETPLNEENAKKKEEGTEEATNKMKDGGVGEEAKVETSSKNDEAEEVDSVEEVAKTEDSANQAEIHEEKQVAPIENAVTEPEDSEGPKKEQSEPDQEVAKTEDAATQAEIHEEKQVAPIENAVPEPEDPAVSKKEKLDDTSVDQGDANKNLVANKEEGEQKKESIPEINLKELSKEQLVDRMALLIEKGNIVTIKPEIEDIKKLVKLKHQAEVEEQKKAFEPQEEGEEFKAENDTVYDRMNYLSNQYRNKRAESAKLNELEKENNLRIKYEIIEEIKALVQSPESLNKTFQHFHELQDRWRNTGNVPRTNVKDLYENYHLHVEIFYDYIKINKELRDYDLKKNLEKKTELCEKAEALNSETSELKAFAELQELHKEWRETGPVPKEVKEEIWERFKSATAVINKKHQKYYDDLRGQQKENLVKKTTLCEKVEEIAEREVRKPKDWNKLADEVLKIQKEWRTIGFAPKKSNNSIYERFRAACDKFFEKKRSYYHDYKKVQEKNLALKNELVEKALSMKDREDWREATEDFIAIQKHWKTIGPVPRKYSDAVWKKFREACDSFFESKSSHFHKVDDKQEENLVAKKALIEKVKTLELVGDIKENIKILNAFKKDWAEIGHVPIKEKDAVYNEFRKAIDEHFDKLDLKEKDRELIKFQSKVEELAQGRNSNKLYAERSKLVLKLKALESDVAVWGNNLGFFSTSKDSENLVKDFEHKIEQAKQRIKVLADKIKMIDKLDA